METELYVNPSCSKCRSAESLLRERGHEPELVRYLDEAPTVAQLEGLMAKLGIDDPREMMRTGERVYEERGLADASPQQLLEAITEEPILLERPILVVGDRAVIARPPERVLDLLGAQPEAGTCR